MAGERCAPIFFAPFVSSPMRIEPAWIDCQGRLSAAYHHLLFERAVEEAFSVIGLGCEDVGESGNRPVPSETYMQHKRDLRAGDHVRVTLQLLDHDGDRLHVYLEMRHAAEGWTASAWQALAVHADAHTRRAEPFPPDVLRNLAVMKAAHSRLGRPVQSCGIAIARPVMEARGPVLAARTRH